MAWSRHNRLLARMLIGGALTVVSAALVVWSLNLLHAAVVFNNLRPLSEDAGEDIQQLSRYVLTLEDLLARDPSNGVIRKRYATALAYQHEYDRALAHLERAMETNSTPDSYFFRGDMRDKLGEPVVALEEMHKALVLDPANPEYHRAYVRLLNRRMEELRMAPMSELEAAQAAFARASREWAIRAPHDMNAFLFLGNYYVVTKDYTPAYLAYLMGLSRAPWMTLSDTFMIDPASALTTIRSILRYGIDPYRGLDFSDGASTGQGSARP